MFLTLVLCSGCQTITKGSPDDFHVKEMKIQPLDLAQTLYLVLKDQ